MYQKELNVKPESACRHFHFKVSTCEHVCYILQQQDMTYCPRQFSTNKIILLF